MDAKTKDSKKNMPSKTASTAALAPAETVAKDASFPTATPAVGQFSRHTSSSPSPEDTQLTTKKVSLITKKELAERYSVTIGCIDHWMKQKRIPYFKLSAKLVRFDPAACDAALKKYEVRSRQ